MATAVDVEPDESEPNSAALAGKLASQVANRIEAEVMHRGWPIGESLGSEPDLRERFGVSRSVLREAVRLVEHHQVARMRRGPNGGLFVCAPDAGPATRAMVIYMEYIGTSAAELMEARLLLEPIAADLAAESITEHGIGSLRATLEAEVPHLDDTSVRSQDLLHPVLGSLSGNPVLHLFIDMLTRLTARYANTSRRLSRAETRAAKEHSHEEHQRIVDAITAGDRARAQTGLAEHLGSIADWIETHRVRRTHRVVGRAIEPELASAPKAKLAEVVAARIHDEITAQGWPVGSLLGSESYLLDRYDISRAVLREAVRLLEYHSVARMRRGPGGGLIVSEPDPQATIDTMALFLEYQQVTAEDLRIVRDAIELETVARVTQRHLDGDPNVALRLGHAVRWATEAPAGEPRKSDLFHAELADLAGSRVLSLLLSILTELFRRHAAGQDRQLPGDEAMHEVQHVHQRILDAVLAGDSGVARHRMRRHLDALTPWWHQ
ncbi:FCD domain-containing protein [Amycolatopsis ultiminotia]|uniref:FCD domain-containing protein n=1 Tax=Amycolatopsis ultiminotia TaxID=543629 RepID=A0ABP6V4R1_9PSEU